jgi:hypothetical protein
MEKKSLKSFNFKLNEYLELELIRIVAKMANMKQSWSSQNTTFFLE